MLSLIVGGDIVPSFGNLEAFANGTINEIADDACQAVLFSADFRVFNLETPITDNLSPIEKEGANFAVSSATVNGLLALKCDVLSLANNHSKDQGEQGLRNTISILNENGITPVGYGYDFENCTSTVFLSKEGKRIAILSCAETEFTIWSGTEMGAVPYYDYQISKMIVQAKQTADVVIVLYHGGKEYFRYVAPYQRERCRQMIDSGADFVFCQHSHCISVAEEYKGNTILYGQGNFIFHQKNNLPETKEGLLARIILSGEEKEIEFIPVVLDENDRVCIAQGQRYAEIMEQFKERSAVLLDDAALRQTYKRFAEKTKHSYYARLQGSSKMVTIIRKIAFKLGVTLYSKKDKLALLNLLQNEAHRELFIEALKNDIGDQLGK